MDGPENGTPGVILAERFTALQWLAPFQSVGRTWTTKRKLLSVPPRRDASDVLEEELFVLPVESVVAAH